MSHPLASGLLLAPLLLLAAPAPAQVRVNPTGVNVSAQSATTVFLTFGGLREDQVAAEAFWCGELVPAAPDVGLRCEPSTLFGRLPLRYDLSRRSGAAGFTDIMSIPPSVARRAYQAAAAGETSSFFYVRRFISLSGGPDEYVAVTCRLTGGGARVPLSLLDVRLAFQVEAPILYLEAGEPAPAVSAEVTYNGTGRLRGRWEVVLPGEELPESRDLLTEATLPLEERGTQRRYTELDRFNVFLPPTGRITLPGPDPERIPTLVEGSYHLLLRIEASDDKEGDSDLAAVGAGDGVVHSGAVAGFPIPTLRYTIGRGGSDAYPTRAMGGLLLATPADGEVLPADTVLELTWMDHRPAGLYRLEIETERGEPVLDALVPAHGRSYRAPSWLAERATALRWRVTALDTGGRILRTSDWRSLRLGLP